MLNILQVGNVGPDSWTPASSENQWQRSLQALGHMVHPVMESKVCGRHARDVLAAQPIDLVVYTRTEGLNWPHADALDVWAECARRGIPTASIHLDIFFGINRRGVLVTRDNALFGTDVAFTADGDHDTEFAEAGINHVWLPPAIVHDEMGRGTPRREHAGEVAFVGSSRGYHGEWPRRPQMVRAAERRWRTRLVRAGDGSNVRGRPLNDLYASVKCSIGDSLAPRMVDSMYWSDRLCDAPGRGSILVHPLMDAAADQLGDAVVWSGWDVQAQLDKAAEVCSWSDEKRQAHIGRALDIIADGHLYTHRMRTVLDHFGLS